jgi:hypothetical protein
MLIINSTRNDEEPIEMTSLTIKKTTIQEQYQKQRLKVCIFKGSEDVVATFDKYDVYYMDDRTFFPTLSFGQRLNVRLRAAFGQSVFLPSEQIRRAEQIHSLYIKKTKWYMNLLDQFVERYSDFDIIVMSTYCPIHPEVLNRLTKPVKILGFIDEPNSTYIRGVPYLWAFDGAFYISPSYDDHNDMATQLAHWGKDKTHFWPLTSNIQNFNADKNFFSKRENEICYVGNYYGSKIDRLIRLKCHFKSRFAIHGRWPLNGMAGFFRPLISKPIFPCRVTSLTAQEKTNLYLNTKIGFNMHLSDMPRETGNMRMYEVPAHGMMLLCDKAALGKHNNIFKENIEAVYYDNIEHAVELAEYYLDNEVERTRIARAGYERFHSDYGWKQNVISLLDWASGLKA